MSVLECKCINLVNFCPLLEVKLDNIKTDITGICYNSTKKIFTDVEGNVHVYSSKWEAINVFKAHTNPIKLCDITPGDTNNLLVTLEQVSTTNKVFLQVFDLNMIRKRDGVNCMGSAKLSVSSAATVVRIQPVANQLCVVIGFELGNLLVYRAQINRDMSSLFRNVNVCLGGITCIEFIEIDLTTSNLFVCSYAGIFCYTVADGNNIADTKNVLDAKNVTTSCSTIRRAIGESYFTVGREDAIYCFTSDGRGPCYGIKGNKQLVTWFGNRLIVVNKPHTSFLPQDSEQLSTLVVIDVENKIVVYNKTMRTIAKVIVDKYNCYVITASKELYALVELDIQSKVRLLIKKNLYDVALNLLKDTENFELIAEVNMEYGNYLLAKGDLTEAVGKYVKTIGYVESYRVIRNLLDSRYNKYLAIYLRTLVQSAHSTTDHLELLRCCTEREDLPLRIKDIFITDIDNCDYTLHSEHNVSRDLAIESAHMSLANFTEIIQDHDHVCKLLNSWTDQHIYDFLSQHWYYIMEKHSTHLLIILKSLFSRGRLTDMVERFIPLFSDTSACIDFLEHVINLCGEKDTMLRNTLVDLYLREWQAGNKSKTQVLQVLNEHKQHLNIEHLLFQCKKFEFWDGIMNLEERNVVRRLCLLQQSNNKIDINDWNSETWMEALEENDNFFNSNSNKIISSVLKSLIKDKHRSLLQLLRNLSDNERLTIGQIKDIFTHGHHSQSILNTNQLYEQLDELKQLLANYSTRPIEFRSNFCDNCRKQIKPPALYYVCQHTYHKECVNKSCIVCMTKESPMSDHDSFAVKNATSSEVSDKSNDNTIETVAKFLSRANVSSIYENPQQGIAPTTSVSGNSSQQWQGRFNTKESKKPQTAEKSLNPFDNDDDDDDNDDKYDANLNPFAK